jgi:hypothetical protein
MCSLFALFVGLKWSALTNIDLMLLADMIKQELPVATGHAQAKSQQNYSHSLSR